MKEEENADILIYGHTHEAFVSEDGTIANTGSWCKTDPEVNPHYNTFLEISNNNVTLKKWSEGRGVSIDKKFSYNQLLTFQTLYK